jgi:tRNA(fMet)-specific endonuclease VapC
MGIILDTSLLIATERGKFEFPAFLNLHSATPVAISAITASELLHGVERATDIAIRRRRSEYVEALLAQMPIAPFGLPEARFHAHLWADLIRRGLLIGSHDMIIAATALSLGFSVATLNRREFERVPALGLVPAESYVLP